MLRSGLIGAVIQLTAIFPDYVVQALTPHTSSQQACKHSIALDVFIVFELCLVNIMPKMEYSVPHCSAVVADSRWTINKDATRRTILRPIRQIISLQITFDQKYSPFEWLIFYRIMPRDGGVLK